MARRDWLDRTMRATSSSWKARRRAFVPHIEGLEDRCVPTGIDYTQVKAQLSGVLNTYQQAVNQEVLSNPLPLVGNGLQSGTDAKFIDALNNKLTPLLPTNPSATASDVTNAIKSALGALGLAQNVDVVQNNANDYEFKVHMAGHESFTRPFNTGLPKLKLTASGNVQVVFDYQFELWFGVVFQNPTTTLYLDTTPSPEVTIKNLNVSIPGSLASAKFGPLDINVYDGAFPLAKKWTTSASMAPSAFTNGLFTLDVTGPRITPAMATLPYFQSHTTLRLTGDAKVNLAVELSVSSFPSFAFNLQVHWPFTLGNLDGDRPTVAFNDVQIDMGSFFQNLITPLMQQVHSTLDPIRPIEQALTKPLPVLSDLGINVSLYDIAKVVAGQLGVNLDFIDKFVAAYDTLYNLSTPANIPILAPQTLIVDYGSFDLGSADPRSPAFDPTTITPNVTATKPSTKSQIQSNAQVTAYIYDSQNGLEGSKLGTLQLPALDDPVTIFRTMLLQTVTLFQYSPPPLDTTGAGHYHLFHLDQTFPILGPVGVRLHGDIDAHASLTVGYDTYGLANYGKPNPILYAPRPTIDALDGIFVNQAQASLTGSFAADLSFSIPLFEFFVGGGVSASVNFNLHPAPIVPPLPVRFTQLVQEFTTGGPLCLFNISGKLDGFLEAGVKIGIDLPFIGFVGVEFDAHIADKTLLDFNFPPCGAPPNPILAQYGPGLPRDLTLNLGSNELARNYQTGATTEVFTVTHKPNDNSPKGDETVLVSAFGFTQEYTHVKRILVSGNNNNEKVFFDPSVKDDVAITSGGGNNQFIYLGTGNATIQVTGNGNNTLTGGQGTNSLSVNGSGSNALTAGNGNDTVTAIGGHDTVTAGTGDDTFIVANGESFLNWQVGDGNLFIRPDGGTNHLQVAGSPGPDNFVLDPYFTRGVLIHANAAKTITATGFIQTVSIDGGAGADHTTVDDLGANTDVRDVAVNPGEAAAGDGSDDVTMVNGAPDYHTLLVTTDAAWLHQPQCDPRGTQCGPLDGGVMLVETRGPNLYKVHVAVTNHEDDLYVNAKGSGNTINVQSNTGHTVINTDTGSDTFNLFAPANPSPGKIYYPPPPNPPPDPNLLFGMRGLLELHGGPGANTLIANDTAATDRATWTLTDATLSGTVQHGSQSLPFLVQYSATGNFAGGIRLSAQPLDTLYVVSTPAGVPVTVSGGAQVVVGSDAQNPNNSTLDTIRGPLYVVGTALVTLNDQKAPAQNYVFDYVLFLGNYVQRGGVTIYYLGVGSLVLNAGNNNNTFAVRDIVSTPVTINTGNGVNAELVGDSVNGNRINYDKPLTINGQSGTNTLTVNDQGTGTANLAYTLTATTLGRTSAGLLTYSNIQSVKLNGGSGNNNTLTLLGTASGTTYAVNAGAGGDTVYFGNNVTPLDSFLGTLNVDGQAGNNTLVVNDTASLIGQSFTLTPNSLVRSGHTIAQYQNFNAFALGAGKGGNSINVPSTAAGTTTLVVAGMGNDTVTVGTLGAGGVIDAILGNLTIQGQVGFNDVLVINDPGHAPSPARMYTVTATQVTRTGPPNPVAPIAYFNLAGLVLNGSSSYVVSATSTPTTLHTGAGDDTITVGDPGNTLNGIQAPLVIDGGAGTNRLILNDQGNPAPQMYTLTATTLTRSFMAPITYASIQQLVLNAGPMGNLLNLQGTAAGSSDTVLAGAGNDAIILGGAAASLDALQGVLAIDGQGGSNALSINDQATPTPSLTYFLTATTFRRSGTNLVNYANIQTVALNTGTGVDAVNVQSTAGPLSVNTFGGGGLDLVALGNAGSVQGIQGAVSIGFASSSATQVRVDDSADPVSQTVTMATSGPNGTITGLLPGGAVISYALAHVSGVAVSGGLGGNVFVITGTGAGFPTSVNPGAAGDQVFVQGSSPTGPLTITTGTGDAVTLGSAANTLDGIGPVNVADPTNSSALIANDLGSGGVNTYTLTTSTFTVARPTTSPLTFSNIATLVLNGGTGSPNLFTVTGTPTGAATTINPGGTGDQVFVQGTAATGSLTVVTAAGDLVYLSNSLGTLDGIGNVSVQDGTTSTTVVVDDSNYAGNEDYTLIDPNLTVGRLPGFGLYYSGIAQLVLKGGSGADIFDLDSTSVPTTAVGGGGGNHFHISPFTQYLASIAGPLTLQGGGSDILEFFDVNNPNSETYSFDSIPSMLSLATVPTFAANWTGMGTVVLETNGMSTVSDPSNSVLVDPSGGPPSPSHGAGKPFAGGQGLAGTAAPQQENVGPADAVVTSVRDRAFMPGEGTLFDGAILDDVFLAGTRSHASGDDVLDDPALAALTVRDAFLLRLGE